jgi:hypothetical protein
MSLLNANVVQLIPCQNATSTVTGTGVDVSGYTDAMQVVLASSVFGGTTPTCNVKIQDSADNSAWSDVTGATFTEVTDAADLTQMITLKVNETAKYIRAVATLAGTSPDGNIAVVALGQRQAGYNASQSI